LKITNLRPWQISIPGEAPWLSGTFVGLVFRGQNRFAKKSFEDVVSSSLQVHHNTSESQHILHAERGVTKMFTAASVMKLVGAGHFRFLAQTSASLCSIPSRRWAQD